MEGLLEALKAAGEPTRLRALAVLARGELTVSELCRVLGQSQPRVSRHLRLLCDAGLLDRHAQGTSAYYRLSRSGAGRRLFDAILPLVDDDDPVVVRDLARLADIRSARAERAAEYFESVASDWDRVRGLHVADTEVERAMVSAVENKNRLSSGGRPPDLLDVGTGTGRVLEIFADQIENGLGIDLSQQMLNLARSRLDHLGLRHCAVQHGNVYDLDVGVGLMDIAVLHHVLHFLDDPAMAINEAARTLRPNGQLLIVDFDSHGLESLRADHAHHWLGFADAEVIAWCEDAGLTDVSVTHLGHTIDAISAGDDSETLTVTLWVAVQRSDAPAFYDLEAAS